MAEGADHDTAEGSAGAGIPSFPPALMAQLFGGGQNPRAISSPLQLGGLTASAPSAGFSQPSTPSQTTPAPPVPSPPPASLASPSTFPRAPAAAPASGTAGSGLSPSSMKLPSTIAGPGASPGSSGGGGGAGGFQLPDNLMQLLASIGFFKGSSSTGSSLSNDLLRRLGSSSGG